MPSLAPTIKARFSQLEEQGNRIPLQGDPGDSWADGPEFHAWASSALHLVDAIFGSQAPHTVRLKSAIETASNSYVSLRQLNACRGAFAGAKADVDGDFVFRLEAQVAGEVFGDLITLAKDALAEGSHHVAAVLACAALEDALKRYAAANDLVVENKTMDEIVNALKGKGLVGGAQKALLSAMPKIRNYAMHADWDKLTPQDVGSVIGFTEQFLLANF